LRKNVGKRLFFHNKKLKKESNYRLHNFRIFFYIFRIYAFLVLMFTYLKMFLHLLLVPKCLFLSQYEQRDANASSNSSHLMASPSSGCAAAHGGGVPAPPAVQRSSQRSSAGSASGKAASTHPTPPSAVTPPSPALPPIATNMSPTVARPWPDRAVIMLPTFVHLIVVGS